MINDMFDIRNSLHFNEFTDHLLRLHWNQIKRDTSDDCHIAVYHIVFNDQFYTMKHNFNLTEI